MGVADRTGSRPALDGPWPPLELLPPDAFSAARGTAADLPRLLLNEARACEPSQWLSRRQAALDACARAAADDPMLLREVRAEWAIDAARDNRLDEAEGAAIAVLAEVPTDGELVARSRALEALGRVQVWRGDRLTAAEGAATLDAAVAGYQELGAREWAGFGLFWMGYAVHFQRGELRAAEDVIRRALTLLAPRSPRRAGVLTYLSEVLMETGRWPEVEAVLAEATALAVGGDLRSKAYVAWSRAHAAALRRDAGATLRLLHDTETYVADWFTTTTGATFLADAAVLCERVGEHDAADAYLRRALVRDSQDEFVRQARAEVLARRGDPEVALRELRALRQAPWLETRELWRHALLAAWASLRARHGDVGRLAAQAFALAGTGGGPAVALTGEPELARALAPAAAAAGSVEAVGVLSPETGLLVRLLGDSSLSRGAQQLALPTGLTGTLVRMLAVHPAGLELEQVIDALWPESDVVGGRRQLRGTLSRLRRRVGDVVVREGSRLRLVRAWVDVVAFGDAAERALAGRGEIDARLALALWGGAPLPADPFAPWAVEVRDRLVRQYLRLLDLLVDASARRGEVEEAVALLEQAVKADPYDEGPYERAAVMLDDAGRPGAASRWRRRADRAIGELV